MIETSNITKAMSNPEIVMELGRRFKKYRLAGNLTQEEVAEKAGVSLWSRWMDYCRKFRCPRMSGRRLSGKKLKG